MREGGLRSADQVYFVQGDIRSLGSPKSHITGLAPQSRMDADDIKPELLRGARLSMYQESLPHSAQVVGRLLLARRLLLMMTGRS